eukprot:Tbor_TRINITY_DN3500_c0_g1::TRINITY_DN3500_c0_g1_i1::g.2981::m.2981
MSFIIADLITAVEEGNCEELRKLVNSGNANHCDCQGISLLSRSISYGHYDVAMLLMQDGNASVSARDNKGFTALHRACWHVGGFDPTGEMSPYGRALKATEKAADEAARAAERNTVSIITLREKSTSSVLRSNRPVNTRPNQSRKSDSDNSATLVPDEVEERTISTSSAVEPIVRFEDMVKELTPKHTCLDVIRMLVQKGADVNHINHTAAVPNSLLERGSQRTPLILAAIRGEEPVVALLVELGADVDFRDSHGMSALDYASFYGQLKVVEYLTGVVTDCTYARKWAAIGLDRANTVSERVSREEINALLCDPVAKQSRVSFQ